MLEVKILYENVFIEIDRKHESVELKKSRLALLLLSQIMIHDYYSIIFPFQSLT